MLDASWVVTYWVRVVMWKVSMVVCCAGNALTVGMGFTFGILLRLVETSVFVLPKDNVCFLRELLDLLATPIHLMGALVRC